MKKIICFVLCVCLFCLGGCQEDPNVITVGASSTPHAEILKECREYIESKGYKLKIIEFTDYNIPNIALLDHDLDANFFQHHDFLNKFNQNHGDKLIAVLDVHFEPLGIYSDKNKSLKYENNLVVAIPNDESNSARALLLLESYNFIILDKNKGFNVTKNDIIDNPYNLEIVEINSELIPVQLSEFDYGVINGNNALAGSVTNKKIVFEKNDSQAIKSLYANVLCVLKSEKDSLKTQVLIDALKKPEINKFIENNYKDLVIPLI